MKSTYKILIYALLLALVSFAVFVAFYEIPSESTTVTKEIRHEINK